MKPKLTKKQRQLWTAVKKAICKHPDQFDMDWWFSELLHFDNMAVLPAGRCGTAGCIGGWAVALGSHRSTKLSAVSNRNAGRFGAIELHASRLLGIAGEAARGRIFDANLWPAKFRKPYAKAALNKEGIKQRVEAACDRIDHFLKTGK